MSFRASLERNWLNIYRGENFFELKFQGKTEHISYDQYNFFFLFTIFRDK